MTFDEFTRELLARIKAAGDHNNNEWGSVAVIEDELWRAENLINDARADVFMAATREARDVLAALRVV